MMDPGVLTDKKGNHIFNLPLSPNDPVVTALWLIGSSADLSDDLFIESPPPLVDGSCDDACCP